MQITETKVTDYDLQKEDEALELAKVYAPQDITVKASYSFKTDELGMAEIVGSKLLIGNVIHEHIGEGALEHEFVFAFQAMVQNLREHGMDFYDAKPVVKKPNTQSKGTSEGLTKGPVSKATQAEIVEYAKAGMTLEEVATKLNRRAEGLKKYWPVLETQTEESEEVIVKK